ncbi:MAG: hypothetical protein DRR42_00860 [Gammaproteobacteria bacterium]|nr:MAG: hypothetical protein DRR42_00860 [Gammaproteobacteria bacterium]
MMLHIRTLILGFVALLYAGWVSALGLGEIKLNSSLNEPLDAEVVLLNVGELSESELLANLASKEDFERAGVDREYHLVNLGFSVDISEPSKPLIRITSSKPIREPYLDFVVELQWPAGKLLREYTLFLDLPVFAAQLPPGKSAAKSYDASKSKKKAESVVAPSARTGGAIAGRADTYRVQSGDTLWKIASRHRPYNSSVQQTMQAIYERNANAFINGNMNLLKKGAVLGLPDQDAVNAVDAEMAKQRIAQSAEELQKSPGVRRELIGGGESDSSIDDSSEPEGVLRLSPPGGVSESSGASGMGATSDSEITNEVLENDLAIAQEGMAKSERENLELREKLAKLEEQLSTMSRMVELSDNQLSAIQEGVGADESTEQRADADTDTAMVVEPVEDEAAMLEEEILPQADDEATEVEVAEIEVADDVAVVEEELPAEGLIPSVKDNLSIVAGILLLIVLAVLFVLARRRKEEEGELFTPETAYSPGVGTAADAALDTGADSADSALLPGLEADDRLALAEDEEVDPIGEADIYLSLGDYHEAEAVIRRALEDRSDDARLHVKLLELFSAQNNLARFDEHYPQLTSLGDVEAIQSADRMRRAMVDGEVGEEDDSTVKAERLDEDFDLELELPAEEEGAADIEPDLGDAAEEELEFDDFDIDEDLDLLGGGDEVATQLELAQAYIDMGDKEGARDILEGIVASGDADQQARAQEIMKQLT